LRECIIDINILMSFNKIQILDCGIGNANSVLNALRYIRIPSEIIYDTKKINLNSKLILPGVGNFHEYVNRLEEVFKFREINRFIIKGEVPILGICVGMQSFFSSSEEESRFKTKLNGLKWLKGNLVSFLNHKRNDLKSPNMGWRHLRIKNDSTLHIVNSKKFYFCHSYYLENFEEQEVMAHSTNGIDFPAVVKSKNIIGCQFHPEKSGKAGLEFLKWYWELNQ